MLDLLLLPYYILSVFLFGWAGEGDGGRFGVHLCTTWTLLRTRGGLQHEKDRSATSLYAEHASRQAKLVMPTVDLQRSE